MSVILEWIRKVSCVGFGCCAKMALYNSQLAIVSCPRECMCSAAPHWGRSKELTAEQEIYPHPEGGINARAP